MKKLLLILIGIIPLPLGYLMNNLMLTAFYNVAVPYEIISVVFIMIWFLLGFLTCNLAKSEMQATILVNFPAFIVLLLIFLQGILGHYFNNFLGKLTQFFYLPILSICYKLTTWSNGLYYAYIMAFTLMFVAFYLGGCIKNHHIKLVKSNNDITL